MQVIWESTACQHGGSVSFSLTVNAVRVSHHSLINNVLARARTLHNRIIMRRRLRETCLTHGVKGWSVTCRDGHYLSPEGKRYNEKSYSIEMVGVSSETLQRVAIDLCRHFAQRSALIHDYNDARFIRVAP